MHEIIPLRKEGDKPVVSILKKLLQQAFQKQKKDPPHVFEVTAEYPCRSDPDIPFESLNPLQSCFRDHYRKYKHCVVEAGTGTGKTALAYIASRCFLDDGQRVVITAPTRELVKSLYRESVGIWGAKVVGLNTGNDRNVADRFFIVTTPEGFISAIRANKEWTKAGLLIVDEAHNILDRDRGGDIDVAITVHTSNGGKFLLMSGTFPNKKEIADLYNADLYISRYRKTQIHVTEIHVPDDLDPKPTPKKYSGVVVPTLSGHIFNRDSIRLRTLKELLKKHENESVIVFVPTKIAGFCLSESLIAPFHCADIAEKEKNRLIAEFNTGVIKTILATNTLSQGVNTPADVVIVCGTRRGSYYLNKAEVDQMLGRAGRNKPDAFVYIMGDKVELFNAKKTALAKSLPLPVESMVLTMLSLRCLRKQDLTDMLGKTYAASLISGDKVEETVERYLRLLRHCSILTEKEGGLYALTKEGTLLARYYVSPISYVSYMRVARRLAEKDLTEAEKGCILLSCIIQNSAVPEMPARLEKDILMKLISLELDRDISSQKVAAFRYYLTKASAIPPYLPYQLRDAERWISLFKDLEKYSVHQKTPGKEWLKNVISLLKSNAAKTAAKNKPVQISFV